jgi:hypothetical protein
MRYPVVLHFGGGNILTHLKKFNVSSFHFEASITLNI